MPVNAWKIRMVFCIISTFNICLYDCENVTEFCPRNKTEWERRSNLFNCTRNKKSYMCLPNEQLSALVEFCYIGDQTPIEPGLCLYLEKRGIGLGFYDCSNFSNGCPYSSYSSETIYTYPNCVSISKGCFLADLSCNRNSSLPTNRSNVTVLLTTSTEPTEGKNEQMHVTVLIAVTLLCVFLIISMTVNIFLLSTKRSYKQLIFCNRPKEESDGNGDGIKCQDETVSLMQDRDQEKKREIVSTEFGNRKQSTPKSDELVDGPVPNYPKGQDSSTIDSGLSISSAFGPLHISCARGKEKIVTALIKKGACINAWDKDGKTPLYKSCENGHIKIVQLLLDHGANVNLGDQDGYSPLCAACQEGYHDIVQLLLDNKADPNMPLMRGDSANYTTTY